MLTPLRGSWLLSASVCTFKKPFSAVQTTLRIAVACTVTCSPGAILSLTHSESLKKKKESAGAAVPLLEHNLCIVQPSSDSAKPGGPLGAPLFFQQ